MSNMTEFGYITIPRRDYEDLLRAKVERDVMAVVLEEEGSYTAERVMRALKQSRESAETTTAAAEGDRDAE